MSSERKWEIVAFGFLCFVLMIFYGDEASAAVASRNGFLHSLGTLIIVGFSSGILTVLLWCVYSGFKSFGKWGRLLIVPWIAASIWRYPYVLNQDWPETNPNPQGTAAVFATFEAAVAVLVITGAGCYSCNRFTIALILSECQRSAEPVWGSFTPFLIEYVSMRFDEAAAAYG